MTPWDGSYSPSSNSSPECCNIGLAAQPVTYIRLPPASAADTCARRFGRRVALCSRSISPHPREEGGRVAEVR